MKTKSIYQCQACGAASPKWIGQCVECSAWNSLIEITQIANSLKQSNQRTSQNYSGEPAKVSYLNEINLVDQPRQSTGIGELDRVLGGGLVAGSVVLLGGDPGIGKSTVLLQMICMQANLYQSKGLYVSGEESLQQVASRAQRLGLANSTLRLLSETSIERILTLAQVEKPQIVIIDSIQTIATESLSAAPGNVSQVRECAAQFVRFAKQTGTTILLVGHVTKEGALAGPRVLEHMVDTVLYFEGNDNSRYRLLRAVKNRYGAVNELGVFVMTDKGLREVNNPSAIFLSRSGNPAPGSVVMVSREGTRPLLIEVQALVDESYATNPRRVTVGLDANRLTMLLAILHRQTGTITYNQDVFVNAVGGVRVQETASDLPVAMAVMSSLKNCPLAEGTVIFGELDLTGDVRPVPNGQERIKEAAKHGFTRAIVPQANLSKEKIPKIEVIGVRKIADAVGLLE